MAPTQHRNRSIRRLHLDLLNPRLGRPEVTTENEATRRLLNDFGLKIVALARSIAEHGLNPTESWAIVEEDDRYVVLEGNRRLVACRLLEKPERAPDKDLRRTFERIRRGATIGEGYLRPSCVMFARRADARYWIHLKHHGAGSGEGTAAWGPEMVYLDQIANGSPPVEWNEFWYWLEKTYRSDQRLAALIQQARREQYTLMERVYDWKIKELLGAGFDQSGKKIRIGVDADKTRPFIEELLHGMLRQQPKGEAGASGARGPVVISSRTLNARDSASDLLGNLWQSTIGDADVTITATTGDDHNEPDEAPQAPTSTEGPAPRGGARAQASAEPGRKSTPSRAAAPHARNRTRKRDTHLYADVSHSNMPQRLAHLLKECAKLEIRSNPEIAAVMARVAVELAIDALIEHRNLTTKKGSKQLFDKIAAVLRHFDPHLDDKTPDRPDLAGTWTAVRTDDASGHFVRDLNSCVHSYQFTATTEVAERANRLFTPLLNSINEELGRPETAVATDE